MSPRRPTATVAVAAVAAGSPRPDGPVPRALQARTLRRRFSQWARWEGMRLLGLVAVALGLGQPAVPDAVGAPPAPAPEAARMATEFLARSEITPFAAPRSLDDALAFQRAFIRRLEPALGQPVGHKIGLVSREAQERFRAQSPVRGILLEQMLLPNGAGVPPGFALRPMFEADLIVVVKDREINEAASIFDVADHLKEVVAFIELPDNFLPTNRPVSAPMLMAGNVGARLGILGQRTPVEPGRRFIESLATLGVTITDQTGAELGRGEGRAILDQPLNAVLWLIEQMERSGEKLKPGDLISLGTIKTIPYPAGKTVTVRYLGLPRGPIEVSATLP